MRLLAATLLAAISLNVLMYHLSRNLLGQVSATYDQATTRRLYLSANAQLQRSLSLYSVGLSTGQNAFVKEANKILGNTTQALIAHKNSDSEMRDINRQLENIRVKLKSFHSNITQKDLISLMDRIENVSFEISQLESRRWKTQLKASEDLLGDYKSLNLLINGLTIIMTLVVGALAFFLHRKYKLEVEISKENHLKSSLFTSLNEAIFVTDSKGRITSCNQSCVRLTGIDSRQVIGRSLESLFNGVKFEGEGYLKQLSLRELISKGKSLAGIRISAKVAGAERFFSINLQPVLDQKNIQDFSMIFSFTDVTEQVLSQKKIKEQQERIVESSKSDLIAQMAGGIAHEINNPLTIISSSMELLDMKAKDNAVLESAVIQKSTSRVISTIERIGKIVNGMLALSRKHSVVFEPVEIGKVIETAIDFSRLILEKKKIEVRILEDNLHLTLECYHIQISQVIINLVKNAVEAIKDLEERWIEIKVIEQADALQLTITDSGTGMSEELKEKILLPFFTSKKVGEGTGLGLSISRTIIENHYGSLDVSRESKHTQFVITLPRRRQELKAAA